MSEEWGPWIEHDGKGCPSGIVPGLYIGVELKDLKTGRMAYNEGRVSRMACAALWWTWGTTAEDVIRYRIRKPRGMTIIDGLLENLPDEVDA